jgi:hypothetical protein
MLAWLCWLSPGDRKRNESREGMTAQISLRKDTNRAHRWRTDPTDRDLLALPSPVPARSIAHRRSLGPRQFGAEQRHGNERQGLPARERRRRGGALQRAGQQPLTAGQGATGEPNRKQNNTFFINTSHGPIYLPFNASWSNSRTDAQNRTITNIDVVLAFDWVDRSITSNCLF